MVDRNGVRHRITHGWNSKEVQVGQYYCDGYAVVDDRKFVFEYNGCAYHSCSRCQQVRVYKNDEDTRKLYFASLSDVTVVEITSCEWYAQKFTIKNFEPEISPLLWKKDVHFTEILDLVSIEKVNGFLIVDICRDDGSQKWIDLNWAPIFKKADIFKSDLPPWMRNLYKQNEFPKEQIVQAMHAEKLLLHTSLVKFYMNHGFRVTKIHKFYEYQPSECFKPIFDLCYEARVQATQTVADENATADQKAAAELKATAVKLVSNSMYGSLLLVSIFIY